MQNSGPCAVSILTMQCGAGVGLGCVILRGVLDRRNAWQIVFRDPRSGRIRRLASSPRMMLRWLLNTYPVQVLLEPSSLLDFLACLCMQYPGASEENTEVLV
jgi:hypothetical protein